MRRGVLPKGAASAPEALHQGHDWMLLEPSTHLAEGQAGRRYERYEDWKREVLRLVGEPGFELVDGVQ